MNILITIILSPKFVLIQISYRGTLHSLIITQVESFFSIRSLFYDNIPEWLLPRSPRTLIKGVGILSYGNNVPWELPLAIFYMSYSFDVTKFENFIKTRNQSAAPTKTWPPSGQVVPMSQLIADSAGCHNPISRFSQSSQFFAIVSHNPHNSLR